MTNPNKAPRRAVTSVLREFENVGLSFTRSPRHTAERHCWAPPRRQGLRAGMASTPTAGDMGSGRREASVRKSMGPWKRSAQICVIRYSETLPSSAFACLAFRIYVNVANEYGSSRVFLPRCSSCGPAAAPSC